MIDFRFVLTAKGFTYAVTICSEVSKSHPQAAATKSFNTDKNTTVIGRLNDTHIFGGSKYCFFKLFIGLAKFDILGQRPNL